MTAGFVFAASCPYDGATLEPLQVGRSSGWQARATVTCTDCRTEFVVAAQIVVTARHGRPTAAKLKQLERARAARQMVNA